MAKCVSSRMLATLLLVAVIFAIAGHYTVELTNANSHHILKAAHGLEMVGNKENWVEDANDWGDVAEARSKPKNARLASASHAIDVISHVAHSAATGTHAKVPKGNFEDEDPRVKAYEKRNGKLSDWAREKELSG